MLPDPLITYAQRHYDLISFDAAQRFDIDRSMWRSYQRQGLVTKLHHNVVSLPDSPSTPEQRIAAAVLSVGQRAIASHRSAAYLWGCRDDADDPVDLIVHRGALPAPRLGVVFHRPRDRADLSVSTRAGIPCTNPIRTLLDVGAVDLLAAISTLDRLITAGLITPLVVASALDRHSSIGRDGLGPARSALRSWPLGMHRPDSQLEIDAARLMMRNGLNGFEFHVRLCGFEVDFVFRRERVIVETDGWEYHQSREAFEEDRRRDIELAADGWRVIRATWRHVHGQPDWFIDRLRDSLSSRPLSRPSMRETNRSPGQTSPADQAGSRN